MKRSELRAFYEAMTGLPAYAKGHYRSDYSTWIERHLAKYWEIVQKEIEREPYKKMAATQKFINERKQTVLMEAER